MTVRLLAAAALLAAAGPAWAQPPLPDKGVGNLLAAFKPVVAAANDSTVRVRADDKAVALGTVVSADGHVLTKASELRGALTVRIEGVEYDAELVAVHKPTDLALIKVAATGLKPVAFADTTGATPGDWLAAAGTGSSPTAAGIVSVVTRKFSALDLTASLNNNRGFLGVILGETDDSGGGAVVESVSGGGAAAKAKVKAGDVIVELNGAEVSGRVGLFELMENYRPGDKVTVKVRRSGELLDLAITLTGRPGGKDRSEIQNSMGGDLSGRRTGFPAVLQTDMVVPPMNCGGPVVDLDGKVLGVCIARAGRVETWVLPGETIKPLVEEMKAGKHRPPAAKTAAKPPAKKGNEPAAEVNK
ncbi:MAG: S1C family serine protease [Gemmataceae bacterium]|nr:S1C family serine protease [Gemmataceae bacterium]